MNIWDIPDTLDEKEFIQILLQCPGIRIEKIVSSGQCSPEGFWYDQKESEWICLLQGEAKIAFSDGREQKLKAGEQLFIPPHQKHRVCFTSCQPPCIWLCIFF